MKVTGKKKYKSHRKLNRVKAGISIEILKDHRAGSNVFYALKDQEWQPGLLYSENYLPQLKKKKKNFPWH